MNSIDRWSIGGTALLGALLLASPQVATAVKDAPDLFVIAPDAYAVAGDEGEELDSALPELESSDEDRSYAADAEPSDDELLSDSDRLFDQPYLEAPEPGQLARSDTGVVPERRVDAQVLVADIEVNNDVVSGVLVNRTSKTIHDITLFVRQTWLWKDERHPGSDNPGRSIEVTVDEPIAPNSSRDFSVQIPALPDRSDGRFVTRAEVTSFTEVGH
jgi:hypothetical protein